MSYATSIQGLQRRQLSTHPKQHDIQGLNKISRMGKDCSSPGKRWAAGRHKITPRTSRAAEEHGELPALLDCALCSSCTCVQLCWPWQGTALTPHLSAIPEVLKGDVSPLGVDSFLGLVSPACLSIGHSFNTVKFMRCREIISAEGILKIRPY